MSARLSTEGLTEVSEYLKLYASLAKKPLRFPRKLKIAVLSSFTLNGLKETLFIKCAEAGIQADIHMGGYNQYAQEILGASSPLYDFQPDLVILFIDARALLGDAYFSAAPESPARRRRWLKEKESELLGLVSKIKARSSSAVLLHNLEVPAASPYGILENKQPLGFLEAVAALNARLRDALKSDSRVFLFDYDAFCSWLGKSRVLDPKLYYLADIKLDPRHLPALCRAYLSYLKPLAGISRKCLVLDLDDTLWGGILGEDGAQGLRLGPTPEGRPFLEFQRGLLALFGRGLLLAVNSKNDSAQALKAIRTHPHMALRERHFAAMRINWDDKVSNMKALAQELNIGLDSLIFLDDDKRNREIMRKALPEVLVVDLPEDPALYCRTLSEIEDLNALQLSAEDRRKGRMYAEQRQRGQFKTSAADISSYLMGLEMTLTFEKAGPFTAPRMAQLTQKTNQFNMTGRRYMEDAIMKLAGSGHLVFSAKVKDRFGDNGAVGLAVVAKGPKVWRIESFLLSCRTIGRGVEDAMLAQIVRKARKAKASALAGEFVATGKNMAARDFYRKAGFALAREEKGRQTWERRLSEGFPFPHYIRIVDKS